MEELYRSIFDAIERNRQIILDAERYIWHNPELGWREWKTHAYLKAQYENLGYVLHEAGDIPGFYVDIETGRPGPKVGVFGEMDALCIPAHPECDKETGAVHACGHHAQSAALLGVAIGLKAFGLLEHLSGSIRLFAVPAEEILDHAFIDEMRKKGVLHMPQGKQEFIYRGYLDGVDMAIMVHGGPKGFSNNMGCNGSINKKFTFKGKAVHASGAFDGHNALYAATNALTAVNALRETFSRRDMAVFHPIITKGGMVINQIPDDVVVEGMVRGLTLPTLLKVSEQINRVFAAAAASMRCELTIEDEFGLFPRTEDENLKDAFHDAAHMVYTPERIHRDYPASAACTDMGDVSVLMPACHAHIGGGQGAIHTTEYRLADPVMACVDCAKIQTATLAILLSDGAERAKKVIAEGHPAFKNKEEYLAKRAEFSYIGNAVFYNEDGTVTLKYMN